ncbi:MAG: hypothetical protein DRP85_07530, partial [Candidatus Makaraimicrobium thalassicum]
MVGWRGYNRKEEDEGGGHFRASRASHLLIILAVLISFLFSATGLSNPEATSFISPLIWRVDGEGDYLLPQFSPGRAYELTHGIRTGGQIKSITASWEFKGKVAMEVSANNGRSYTSVVNGVPLTDGFMPGSRIRWRVIMGPDSELTEVKMVYTDVSGVQGSFGEPELSGFRFRKPVYIDNPSGEELFNYQVLIKVGASEGVEGCDVHCGGSVTADFTGIRFTAADGETLLAYYRESVTDSGHDKLACFWVKVPQLPEDGVGIYVYYGNNGAEDLSSGEAAFDFFDDFSKETLDTEKWEVYPELGGECSVVNSRLKLDSAKMISKDYQAGDGIIEYQANAVSGHETRLIVKTGKEPAASEDFTQLVYSSAYEGAEHCIVIGDIVKANDDKPISAGTEYNYRVVTRGTEIRFDRYDDGFAEAEASVSFEDTGGLASGHIGLESGKGNVTYYNWIRVRKFADPEPAADVSHAPAPEERVDQPVFINTTITGRGDLTALDTRAAGTYISKNIFSPFTARIVVSDWRPADNGISIDVSADGGGHYRENCEADTLYYVSKGDFTAGSRMKFRVTIPETDPGEAFPLELEELAMDYRPGDIFVIAPNGGETWEQGTRKEIMWTASQYGEDYPMKLEYSLDGGRTYKVIAEDAADTGSFPWTVPAHGVSEQARVRVSDAYDNSIGDESDDVFAIIPFTGEQAEEAPAEEADTEEGEAAGEEEEIILEEEEEVLRGVMIPGRGFLVDLYNAQTDPEDFYLKDENGVYVPYIFLEIAPDHYEVLIKTLNGVQKYIFTGKGVALLEDEGEGFKEKVRNSWFYVQKRGFFPWQWQDIETEEGKLSYEENDNGTITICNSSPLGTLTANLGFDGDIYYNKFSFNSCIPGSGQGNTRVYWDTVLAGEDAIAADITDVRRLVKKKVKRFLRRPREELVEEKVLREKFDNIVIDWRDFTENKKRAGEGEGLFGFLRGEQSETRAQRMTAANRENPHQASTCRVWFYENGNRGGIDIDPILSAEEGIGMVTVRTGGLTTSDFKLTFNGAVDSGVSEFCKGTGSAWSANYGSDTEFLTELDQDASAQVDQTSMRLKVVEANPVRARISNEFSLGTEADVTEEWTIYPTGKIVKRVKYVKSEPGTETRSVDDGQTDYVAAGMSGYHGSTPAVDRATNTYYDTQIIEIIGTDTGEVTDYQNPGAPVLTIGTLETTVLGDDDNDGFNEGEGAYEIRAAQNDFAFTFDGSSQTRYKPVFKIHDMYPVTGAGSHILAHYRCDETSGTAVDNAEGTAGRDAVSSEDVATDITTTTARRGTAFNIDEDGENLSATSANIMSDWSKGTIEFWYRPNYDFVAAQAEAKYLFGSAATG